MWGAYRGFFDNNIQADWVHIDDIDAYDTLYAALPDRADRRERREARGLGRRPAAR